MWRGWWQALSQRYQLIRFDERGCGMSDWDVEDLSLEASVRDLEVLVDSIGLERFPLLGISHGGAIAIRYADRHPERVSRLILYGAYALGRDLMATTEAERKANDALRTAMHIGWGTDDPAFRLIYAHKFMPEGPLEQWQAFAELQRHTASAEGAVRLWTEYGSVDVRDGARRIRVPTLILHARDEILRRFDDARLLAELIPDSELVPLPSCNHILQRGEPAFEQFLAEVDRFLAAA